MAAGTSVVAKGNADGGFLRSDAVVKREDIFGDITPGEMHGFAGPGEFGGEVFGAVLKRLDANAGVGDILIDLGFGLLEAGAGIVDGEHDLEFFFLEFADVLTGGFDLIADGLILVVLFDLHLLGLVFGEGGLLGLNVYFGEFFLRFEGVEFGAGLVDGAFLGGDGIFDLGDFDGD